MSSSIPVLKNLWIRLSQLLNLLCGQPRISQHLGDELSALDVTEKGWLFLEQANHL